jgi:hypothetical protein
MKRNVWLFIDKKSLKVMNFWSKKKWIGHLIRTSQNGKNNIDSHSNFFIGIQYMMYYEMINSHNESFLWKPEPFNI